MLPTFYISHGGGPWPWLQGPMHDAHASLATALRAMPGQVGARPAAVLMVSAHWEAPRFTVMSSGRPPMLYDYGGFPEHTYRVHYPAPGAPALAARVQGLLRDAGLPCDADAQRGFDHGAFVPLALIYPDADVPLVQLSLKQGLDPQEHLAVGAALAPLREQGVLIIGSGSSFHNLALRGPAASASSQAFDAWLGQTLGDAAIARRQQLLSRWAEAPAARQAHAREEHLLPLMVAAGAAVGQSSTRIFHEPAFFGGVVMSSWRFGATA